MGPTWAVPGLLVGAFSFKGKMPDTYSDLILTTDLTLKGPLFTETTKTNEAKYGQRKLGAKGPSFKFFYFLNCVTHKTGRDRGSLFQFFSAL